MKSTQDAQSRRDDDSTRTNADRRSFLGAGASVLMAGGLAAGYGTFFFMAGKYLFPVGDGTAWMFVSDARGIEPGESMPFTSPTGVQVTITRRADSPANRDPSEADFLALSSICPHLGCRVHWEPHNDRFFCPCHNGVFDPTGKPISGPPAAANQSLPTYDLQVVDGTLYIRMPFESVSAVARIEHGCRRECLATRANVAAQKSGGVS